MSTERDRGDLGDRLRQEAGVALIFALLSAVILSGVAVLFVATAINETRFTGGARDFEIALHVAEAGSDEVIARVNREEDFSTKDSGGSDHVLDQAVYDTEEEQREWAVQTVRNDAGLAALVTGRSGEAFGIRPLDADTNQPLDMIFGVSFVPSRDDPQRVRVVKLQFDRKFFQPTHGLLNCGDLEIGGNGKVLGNIGSVHSNGDVTVGGSHEIAEELTSSGSITGTPNAGGGYESNTPEEFCPHVEADDFYGRAELPYTCYAPDATPCTQAKGTDGKAILWWDLCADGTARKASSSPCIGEIVYQQGMGANNHLGWKFSTPGGDPTWGVTDIQSGIYYIERGVGSIQGKGSGTVTVLVELDESDDGDTGNLSFRGSSTIDPALEGLLFVADRDFEANGTASGGGLNAEGLIAVGEQVKLDGTASFRGTIYAQDKPHTPDSPVSKSTVKGNFSLTYDNQLDVPLIGIIRITAWNEL